MVGVTSKFVESGAMLQHNWLYKLVCSRKTFDCNRRHRHRVFRSLLRCVSLISMLDRFANAQFWNNSFAARCFTILQICQRLSRDIWFRFSYYCTLWPYHTLRAFSRRIEGELNNSINMLTALILNFNHRADDHCLNFWQSKLLWRWVGCLCYSVTATSNH